MTFFDAWQFRSLFFPELNELPIRIEPQNILFKAGLNNFFFFVIHSSVFINSWNWKIGRSPNFCYEWWTVFHLFGDPWLKGPLRIELEWLFNLYLVRDFSPLKSAVMRQDRQVALICFFSNRWDRLLWLDEPEVHRLLPRPDGPTGRKCFFILPTSSRNDIPSIGSCCNKVSVIIFQFGHLI